MKRLLRVIAQDFRDLAVGTSIWVAVPILFWLAVLWVLQVFLNALAHRL
jgi:hypothetical protein